MASLGARRPLAPGTSLARVPIELLLTADATPLHLSPEIAPYTKRDAAILNQIPGYSYATRDEPLKQ